MAEVLGLGTIDQADPFQDSDQGLIEVRCWTGKTRLWWQAEWAATRHPPQGG